MRLFGTVCNNFSNEGKSDSHEVLESSIVANDVDSCLHFVICRRCCMYRFDHALELLLTHSYKQVATMTGISRATL